MTTPVLMPTMEELAERLLQGQTLLDQSDDHLLEVVGVLVGLEQEASHL